MHPHTNYHLNSDPVANNSCNICYWCLYQLCIVSNNPLCPNCNALINLDNIIKTNDRDNIQWLYSSNYDATWWCYNYDGNMMIEQMYQDHLNLTEQNNQLPQDNTIDSQNCIIPDTDKQPVIVAVPHPDNQSVLTTVNDVNFDDLEPIVPPQLTNTTKKPLNYIIKINDNDYKIDFDQMKQIHIIEHWRKRNIKRITYNETKINMSINDYLKNEQSVLGFAGIKF